MDIYTYFAQKLDHPKLFDWEEEEEEEERKKKKWWRSFEFFFFFFFLGGKESPVDRGLVGSGSR